jgi:hypothetical protein
LNHQKKHQTFQEMFQSCLKKEINILKKNVTMLKLCLIIRCQWVQLGSNHLDNGVDEVGWWDILNELTKSQNFERVPSNFSCKLICRSFKMPPNVANVWFSCKCAMDSQRD